MQKLVTLGRGAFAGGPAPTGLNSSPSGTCQHRQIEENHADDETSTIEQFAAQDYKFGFITDVEQETFPPGLNEDVIARLLGQEGGARVDARVAPQGLPPLARR